MLGGAGSSSSSRPVEMGALKNEGHWAGTIAAPVTYVVDPNGKVKWAYTSANASDRPSPVALESKHSRRQAQRRRTPIVGSPKGAAYAR